MSIVSLLGIEVLNNPAKFNDPYEFEITFECLEPLKEDLEWKLTYVGSSRSLDHDQELDSILVGPVPVGINKFLFQADPPSAELIPANELVSVTVILLSCSYNDREFVRVGYYVNNEYDSEELRENPPAKVQVEHVIRNILAEKPRVTRFNIVWDNEDGNADEYPPEQQEEEEQEGNEKKEEEDEEEEEEEEEEEASSSSSTTINKKKRKLEDDEDEEEIDIEEEEDIEEDLGEEEGEEDLKDLEEDEQQDDDQEDGTEKLNGSETPIDKVQST
ncbi:Asf1 protein [Scheffersomyces coipomensis]|uniref:Asf1 protein n=1 Tax=Scheffersomyces coipomensis TaxID=1788519 RepID=UPI00315D7735